MPIFTVNSGAPEIEDGVYSVVLTDIKGPKTVLATRGPKAGQEIQLFDWDFAILDDGPQKDVVVSASTSTASGPKSKMYIFLSALLGKKPEIGQGFELTDLVGRMALATIEKDDGGWPRLSNLSAMPRAALQQQFGKVTGAPTQGTPIPAGVSAAPLNGLPAAAAPTDDLPF